MDFFSATHLHLMLNHVPILGTAFVAILLACGLVRRSREVTSLGLLFTILLALVTIPIYLTGEPTEEQQEHTAWLDKRRVHEHEEKAETGLIAVLVTGTAALAAAWLRRGGRDGNRVLTGATLVLMLVSAGLFAVAGLEGGQIRHEELRSGAAAATTAEPTGRD